MVSLQGVDMVVAWLGWDVDTSETGLEFVMVVAPVGCSWGGVEPWGITGTGQGGDTVVALLGWYKEVTLCWH